MYINSLISTLLMLSGDCFYCCNLFLMSLVINWL